MRITIVLPTVGMSGGIRVLADYAQRLKNLGHDVALVSVPCRPPKAKEKLLSLLSGHGWPRYEKRGPSHVDATDVPHRMIERHRPITDADVPDAEVVIATWWETAHWVRGLSPRKGVKVYFVQDYGAPGQALEALRETWRMPFHMITISGWLRDLLVQEGVQEVSLVPNAVDLDMFNAPPRVKPERPIVGFVYSTHRQKGVDLLLEAISLASRSVPGLEVVCFGSHEPSPDLPLPPGARYFHRAPNERLKEFYAMCTVWLFGSRREGFGLPILEAMACGTPVVAMPGGAAPEVVTPEVGVLTQSHDPAEMAGGIARICALPDEAWRAMSEACRGKMAAYTLEDATAAFEGALERAIERHRAGELNSAGA